MNRRMFRHPSACLALIALLLLSACSDGEKLPQPPLSFPFDTQKAGFKIETDFRVVDYDVYELGFTLAFKEGDATDRARVVTLAGNPWEHKNGTLAEPGVPIRVRVHVNAKRPSSLEVPYDKEFLEERPNGASATHVYTDITSLKLKPGTYQLVIENLKAVPELQGTPVTLYLASQPKTNPIQD